MTNIPFHRDTITVSQFLTLFTTKMKEINKGKGKGEGEGEGEEEEAEKYSLVSVSKPIGFISANVTNLTNVRRVSRNS